MDGDLEPAPALMDLTLRCLASSLGPMSFELLELFSRLPAHPLLITQPACPSLCSTRHGSLNRRRRGSRHPRLASHAARDARSDDGHGVAGAQGGARVHAVDRVIEVHIDGAQIAANIPSSPPSSIAPSVTPDLEPHIPPDILLPAPAAAGARRPRRPQHRRAQQQPQHRRRPLSLSSPPGSRGGSRAASRAGSRAPSLLDAAGPSSAAEEAMAALKCDVMVNWLHHQQEERRWTRGGPGEGVVLKRARGAYVCAPEALAAEEGEEAGDAAGEGWEGDGDRWDGRGFLAAVRGLNVRVGPAVSFIISFQG